MEIVGTAKIIKTLEVEKNTILQLNRPLPSRNYNL